MADIGGRTATASVRWRYEDALYRRARDIVYDHLDEAHHSHGSETVPSRAREQAAAFADRVAWGSDAFVLRKIRGWGALSERVCARIEAERDEIASSNHRLEPGTCRFAYNGTPVVVAVRERRPTPREADETGPGTAQAPPHWFPVRWALPARSREGIVEAEARPRLEFNETVTLGGEATQWIEFPRLPTAELALWAVDPIASDESCTEKREGVVSRAVDLFRE